MDVDHLKGAHAKRLPAVGHPVGMDALQRGRYGNGLRRGAGSCTHAPQAAVNDKALGSEKGGQNTHTHTHRQVGRLHLEVRPLEDTCEYLFSGGLTSSHSVENIHIYPRQVSIPKIELQAGG